MGTYDFVSCENNAEVLDRIIEAYGFSSKIMLAEHFNMAASSLSGRYKRSIFPADMVIRCMHETGANLEWLAFGTGHPFDHEKVDILKLPNHRLVDGNLKQSGHIMFDKVMLTNGALLPSDPVSIQEDKDYYVIDRKFADVFDGKWLVDIEGKISIRELTRIPIKRVRVTGAGIPFDCDLSDLTVLGRVIKEIKDY
ncbi:Repressor protein CI [Xenorhabdus bovienii str. Jollieti]|uniref:Repressor protein CI n=1 Tax=Xenorhabdus bovienii (strain SS-2004) TaxID=406818 RepID=D3UX80_XENBS|nr:phage repressor protein [Xenorhabdus bovienii]CBJ80125.1 Repressor protein CI [Xenorhabdus bovienii SS-2004]CDH29838.1 Repressor protein CI [Xenorhabdus bovienii str. Jollieti]